MRKAKKPCLDLRAETMPDFDMETAPASRLKSCSEMKIIKPLPDSVRNSMRSGIILFDMTRVVEELIFNSLDSGATKVSIFVGVDTCCIKIVDDGYGISREGLGMLGDRYATSKLQDFADMEVSSENLGFRGEALASISYISVVEIATKAIGRPNGYRKVMKGSKCIYLGIDDDQKEVGTTVVVRDLFYNQPVRRKYMQSSPKRVLLSVKKCLLQIALIHHRVCFRLFDIESDEELFRTDSSSSPLPLLMNASGIRDQTSLHRVNASDGTIRISGYLSNPEDSFGSKGFQHLYINSRFIGKCPIHKLLYQLAIDYDNSNQWKTSGVPQRGKRSRPQANPSYILNLICSRCLYDLTFEPSKTCVEFKDWGPILAFVEKVVQALGKRISLLVDIMESTRTKRRKQNHQTSSLFHSDDLTKDGDYLFDGNFEWTPCLEFKDDTRGVEEQDSVGEYLEVHRSSSRDMMALKEDFPLIDDTDDFLVTNNTRSIDRGVWKQLEESGFDFDKFDDGLDADQNIKKPFLHSCTSRESILFDVDQNTKKPFLPSCKSRESMLFDEPVVPRADTGSCKTKREGLFHDGDSVILEFQARSLSLDCSPGTPKEVENLFCLQHPKERYKRKMETYYDPFITDPDQLNLSSEERIIREKLESAAQPENLDLNSSYHLVNLSPETMWDSDCFTSSGLYGSSRWQRRPSHGNLADEEDNNLIFDDAILTQISRRENTEVEFSNSYFSMKDHTSSCKFEKFLKRDNLDGLSFQGTNNVLADQMGRYSRLANHMGINSHDIRRDTFRHKDSEQNSAPQARPRRSLSAPPFYRQKKRFVSLSHSRPLFAAATDDGDENHLQKSCVVSHVQLKADFNKQRAKIGTDVASNEKSAMELERSLHSQRQEEAQVTDIVLEENQGPLNSFTKWRHNSLLDTLKAPIKSREVQDQDSILDLSSESLRNLAGASLVPDMNRNFLEDAKALQQVDKKFIPVVFGGKLAIIDQHAADERIRLEELRREVLSGKEKKVTYLDAEEELMLPEMGYQLLQSYADQIKEWGWICHINGQGPKSFKKNMDILSRQPTTITLIAVPCILGVNLTDADLSEFLQQLADTDGSSTIPPSVLRVLNSKACRCAIMFGDTLLPSECSLIVEELKQTSLCFQCAHGRPTTVPLVDMKMLRKQISKIGTNRSWHGLDRQEITLDRAKMRLHAAQC